MARIYKYAKIPKCSIELNSLAEVVCSDSFAWGVVAFQISVQFTNFISGVQGIKVYQKHKCTIISTTPSTVRCLTPVHNLTTKPTPSNTNYLMSIPVTFLMTTNIRQINISINPANFKSKIITISQTRLSNRWSLKAGHQAISTNSQTWPMNSVISHKIYQREICHKCKNVTKR